MKSLSEYIYELTYRIRSAVYVEYKPIEIDCWQPVEYRCHDNVVKLCELDSSYSRVYGFLFSDTSQLGYVSFIFHSVARDQNDNLVDITPNTARNKYPFITANIPDEHYRELMYKFENEIQVPLGNT